MARPRRVPAPVPAARVLPDFSHLPERVRLEDMVTSQPASAVRDPYDGKDLDGEWLVRYGLAIVV